MFSRNNNRMFLKRFLKQKKKKITKFQEPGEKIGKVTPLFSFFKREFTSLHTAIIK